MNFPTERWQGQAGHERLRIRRRSRIGIRAEFHFHAFCGERFDLERAFTKRHGRPDEGGFLQGHFERAIPIVEARKAESLPKVSA